MSEMFPSDLSSLPPKQPAKDMVVIINARKIAWCVLFMYGNICRAAINHIPSEFTV